MWRVLWSRAKQGHRTMAYPAEVPALSDRYLGRPKMDVARCGADCQACIDVCPTDAIVRETRQEGTMGAGKVDERTSKALRIDLGRCLFCQECVKACPEGAIEFTGNHRLAARTRSDLVVEGEAKRLFAALDERMLRVFRRSLKLRQVSAGGCNACEADVNVLNTIGFDWGRFGIQCVASPRHADGLLVTGPVTENMRAALLKTYEAVASPKLVIAVGACAISGGPFSGLGAQNDGLGTLLPVDLYIPGCPPHPLTILEGLLGLLGRIEHDAPP
ncbi:MAG: 4Fe-4S dicluster domain-containing protein [Deltaproteobacteria bacterium]|nr:4Fe-4S dicluster domain-containing protein [Deltaproteobacteria bacterium]